MFKSERDSITERRRLLQNPYAYIEHLEARESELDDDKQLPASDSQVSSSRKLMENPYAYLDGSGLFSAIANSDRDKLGKSSLAADLTSRRTPSGRKTPSFYSNHEIESKVKNIHDLIWREKQAIWNDAVPTDPVDMLDPAVALRLIGYEFQLDDGLGQYRGEGGLLEVAGLIDHSSRTVHISGQFPNRVRTFTAAHELGHAMLHQSASGVHRDRPMDGSTLSRERSEIEADKFATFFLMPARLVRSRFAAAFKDNVFYLNEDTSFALAGISYPEMQRRCKTRRDLSRLLASTERYDGRSFPSLAAQFHVSIEAMAIRIEELDLLVI